MSLNILIYILILFLIVFLFYRYELSDQKYKILKRMPIKKETVRFDGYAMGTYFEKSKLPLKAILPGDAETLPDSFNKWYENGYINPPRNQGQCGSCWAFSITSILEVRLCLITCGKWRYEFSPQFLIACDNDEDSCGGSSSLYRVFKDMTHDGNLRGIYREIDYPYTGKEDGCLLLSSNRGNEYKRYDFDSNSIVTLSESNSVAEMTSDQLKRNIIRIKKDIYDNGPVSAAMIVYPDFMTYKGGVYEHSHNSTQKPVGGHAVVIIGWGKDGGGDYWICKNSWGLGWGLQGFWKHRIGDACLIESNCHSGRPDINITKHPDLQTYLKGCNKKFGHLHTTVK